MTSHIPSSPIRVLVVDDQPWARRVTVAALAYSGRFDVLEAPSGAAALDLAREAAPDVVLLDYVLPDMDGGRVLDALQAAKPRPPCVVIMTALADADREAGLLDRGAAAVLRKPLDLETLAEQIMRFASEDG